MNIHKVCGSLECHFLKIIHLTFKPHRKLMLSKVEKCVYEEYKALEKR